MLNLELYHNGYGWVDVSSFKVHSMLPNTMAVLLQYSTLGFLILLLHY